ncbi:MAG: SGNH/GDSL hydrolase family protein [Vicinamibacteraceae bacterium]|nr:SGNH/GDSL hydrolase family protein [Vicinamibacteraceae bacterium]
MGTRARRVVWFLAMVAAQFFVFEAGMRVVGGSEAAPEFQSLFMRDPRVGHRLQPGASTRYKTPEFETDLAINSRGVRDEEFGRKAPGERRVVVLGDSLVMSVQVPLEQTFMKVAERALNAERGGQEHWRVINAGVQGYGPVEEWRFFEHVASHFEADVVIVAVFVANDAIEAVDSDARVALEATGRDLVADLEEAARRTVRRSMVLQTLRLRARAVIDRVRAEPQADVPQRPLATYFANPPGDVRRGLELTRDYIGRIARLAEARGARTAIVLLPARFQLDDGDYGRLHETVTRAGATLVRDAASERFAEALAPLGLPMLDLLPVLRAQPDPAGLFFQRNIHLTRRGHEVAGAALAGFVGEQVEAPRAPDATP